jgi:two-component system, cell cycle sensor histidine kinase and response regulator CckA
VYGWLAAVIVLAAFLVLLATSRRKLTHLTARAEEMQSAMGMQECIERQLQASQSNLQMATDASGTGTWYWDLQSDELTCSGQASQLFGFSANRTYRSTDFFSKIHPDDQDRIRPELEEAFRSGGRFQLDYRSLGEQGKASWVSIAGRALRDSDGEVRRVAGVISDVTDRKRLEESFYQAQKMEAVGRVAGSVAHDFNNMLGVISAYGELLLLEPGLPAGAAKRVTEIMNAARRANSLTRQLLAFSRKQVINPTALDLNTVVLDVKDMLERMVGNNVQVVTELAATVPAIRADKGQLEQVLLNFAANSRDAMPKGGTFTLKTSFASSDPRTGRVSEAGYVLLEVADTGCGMTAEVLAHIFEPFFTTKAAGRGTGLGLATAYGVVEQLHGQIKVESTVNEGTTFRIYLPAIATAAAVETVAPKAVVAPVHATVLLVEDENSLRDVLAEFLESAGMRVLTADNGRKALDKIEAGEKFDVLVTDLVMPEIDGRTLAAAARTRREGLQVLYMSGHTGDSLVRRELQQQGLPYLQKPFSRTDLVNAIHAMLPQVS